MPDAIKPVAEWCAALVETLGISIISGVAIYTFFLLAVQLLKKETAEAIFQRVRQHLGRGILLGLEFLVAGDIIQTVAIELTFETLGELAIIVLIRTFLSFTLDVELTGSWPWQSGK